MIQGIGNLHRRSAGVIGLHASFHCLHDIVYIELVHPGFVPSFWGTVPVGEGDDFRSRPLEQFRKKWRKLVCFKVGEE